MAGIGVTKPGLGNTYTVTPSALTSWTTGAESVSGMVIAFTGHIAYPSIISEMRKPKDFPKALALLQVNAIVFYTTVAVVIYYFAGENVASPALGSASPVVRKVCYGIAMPTIVVAGVINAHVCVKNVYKNYWVGIKKNAAVMSEKTCRARGSWWLILSVVWIIALLISGAIPVFHQLLGLIGAAFCTWFTLGFSAIFWLSMQWIKRDKLRFWPTLRLNLADSYFKNWKKACLTLVNIAILGMSIAIVRSAFLHLLTLG